MGNAPKLKIYEEFPRKYFNFVVNMGRSLGRRSDSRSYVNIGFFPLEGNPQFI